MWLMQRWRIFIVVLFFLVQPVLAQDDSIFDNLNNLLQKAESDSARVLLHTRIAREYIYVDITKANSHIQKALELAEAADLEHEKAYALRILGAVLRENGMYLQGAEILLDAKSAFEKHDDQLGVANCYVSLGHVYDYLGDSKLAIDFGQKALEIYESLGLPERIGVVTNNLGRSYYNLSRYDSARIFTRQSIKYNLKISNKPLLESNYRNLGMILSKQQQNDSARKYLNKVVAMHKSLKGSSNTWAAAESYLTLAQISLTERNYDSVSHYLDQTRELSSKYGYLEILQEVMETSFQYYEASGDREGFHEAWEKYLSVTDSLWLRERRNKKDVVDWYNERLDKESEIEAFNLQVGRQKVQIVTLAVIIVLSLIILAMFIYYNRRNNKINNMLLEQKEKLERLNHSKDKLFSIVAHDFRSPIASLLGFANMIQDYADNMTAKDLKKMGKEMDKAVSNTLALSENLLSWAKSQMDGAARNPQIFDLRDLLQKIHQQHNDIANNKNITLEARFQENLLVFADAEEMEVAIRNLITNAIKFSEPGDTIWLNAHFEDNSVILTIRDEGIGMSEKTRQGLFDISKKTGIKGTAGEIGSGLGLVLCKEFVDQNEGTISVESELDKGTTFTIKLPYRKA